MWVGRNVERSTKKKSRLKNVDKMAKIKGIKCFRLSVSQGLGIGADSLASSFHPAHCHEKDKKFSKDEKMCPHDRSYLEKSVTILKVTEE